MLKRKSILCRKEELAATGWPVNSYPNENCISLSETESLPNCGKANKRMKELYIYKSKTCRGT